MHGGPTRLARNSRWMGWMGGRGNHRDRTTRKKGREGMGRVRAKKGSKIIFNINAVNASARCYQNQSYQKVSLSLSRW